MPAKKKNSKSKKKSSSKKESVSLWSKYLRERDQFYVAHPYSRLLLGALIVAFAISIGLLYYNKNIIYIGLSLDEYGIYYPYISSR